MLELNNCLKILKMHDYNTYLHSRRVASIAMLLGEKMRLGSKEIEELMIASLLHDVGKIKINKNILNKTGILNVNERLEIKNHPRYGVEMIKGVKGLPKVIIDGIYYHHEFYNGNGYPKGLRGESVPLFARIIAIADAFDAMTNSRPYRDKPLSLDEALSEIEIHAGIQFDPFIVSEIKMLNINNLNN